MLSRHIAADLSRDQAPSPDLERGGDDNTVESHDGWRRFGEPDSVDGDGDAMFVFIAKRRPESSGWQVPDDDKCLLEGVGAKGTENRKGDDSFEVMLEGMSGLSVEGAQVRLSPLHPACWLWP